MLDAKRLTIEAHKLVVWPRDIKTNHDPPTPFLFSAMFGQSSATATATATQPHPKIFNKATSSPVAVHRSAFRSGP
jgi:hypothetical protein